MQSCSHFVTWIGEPPGRDEEAWLVWSAVVERGLERDIDVVAAVAEALFRRDATETAPSSGVGIFRRLYDGEAWRLLFRLDGTRIRIGETVAWVQ
jgi:hypothetical protein